VQGVPKWDIESPGVVGWDLEISGKSSGYWMWRCGRAAGGAQSCRKFPINVKVELVSSRRNGCLRKLLLIKHPERQNQQPSHQGQNQHPERQNHHCCCHHLHQRRLRKIMVVDFAVDTLALVNVIIVIVNVIYRKLSTTSSSSY